MNTTNYKSIYTNIVNEMVDKINDQLNHWYVKKERKWNALHPTYPYTGNKIVIFLGFDIELKENEDLCPSPCPPYPTAIIKVSVRTRRIYRGDSLYEEKHFPTTQIEFNLKSGLANLHDKIIHSFGIGPHCQLLKNMEKYKNIHEDFKNLKEKIEDIEQAFKIADDPKFRSDRYRNYFNNFEENIIHTMYICNTAEDAVRLFKRDYCDMPMKDNDFIITVIETFFSVTDGDEFNKNRAFFWEELQNSRETFNMLKSVKETL